MANDFGERVGFVIVENKIPRVNFLLDKVEIGKRRIRAAHHVETGGDCVIKPLRLHGSQSFDAANKIGKLLRRDFDSHFAVHIHARERIDRQTLFGQPNHFGARHLNEFGIIRHVAFGVMEKDEVNREIRLQTDLREQVFDKLRFPAARFSGHGEITIGAAVEFDDNQLVVVHVPTNLQLE